ncbi:MAG: protein kinase [Bryobacteraceae bacterium]
MSSTLPTGIRRWLRPAAEVGPRTWRRVKDVYSAARDLPPEQREAFVERVAADHPDVVEETLRLLRLDDGAEERIESLAAPARRAHQELTGRVFRPGERPAGRFEIRRFVAAGGMGEVYEADDLERGERVAIKALRAEFATADHISWLRREIEAGRRVRHPNVCRLVELVETGRAVFLTMEMLDGETLASLLEREGALTERRALPIIRQVVAGLAAAHEAGIVHRDLKPANIMIVPRPGAAPRVIITDFGMARTPSASSSATYDSRTFTSAFGTPSYMAPEQALGKTPGPAADIYALGAVVYEMVTGEAPFAGESAISAVIRKTRESPEPPRRFSPALRAHWNEAIMRCLRVDPAARFRSAIHVLEALQAGSRTTVRIRRARRALVRIVRHWWIAAAVVACIAAAAIWLAAHRTPTGESMTAWKRAISSLHGGEPLVAVRQLELAASAGTLPARARADLALAWSELGFADRAETELARLPMFTAGADRRYADAVRARIRGDRAASRQLLASIAGLGFEADRAWFEEGPSKDLWTAVVAREPENAAAHLQLAEAAAADGKWRAAEREYITAQTYYSAQANPDLARAVAARRGMRRLAAGQLELAARDLAGITRPPTGSGAGPCERVAVITVGEADDFASPPDPVVYVSPRTEMPGAGVPGVLRRFDDGLMDRQFVVSIPLPNVRACSGWIEARVRRSPSMVGAANDFLTLGAAPLSGALSGAIQVPLWQGETDGDVKTMSVDLRADLFASVFRAYAGERIASLDISGGDDTDFDYIRLTVIY